MEDYRLAKPHEPELIDDLRFDPPLTVAGNGWTLISDRVMGGASTGRMTREVVRPRGHPNDGWRKRVTLPFDVFIPHRTERPLNLNRLRRIGIVAIGREFEADIAIVDIRFYGDQKTEWS